MSGFDRETAVRLILKGRSPRVAVGVARLKGGVARRIGGTFLTRWIVAPVGKLGDAPDPACVARHLKAIANPTRKDVEQALDKCSR